MNGTWRWRRREAAAAAEAGGLKASVIVLNFDGRRYLDTCLDAVLAQELEGGFEIVLVDNGSRDGSAQHVRAQFPEVRVIESDVNLGFAAGNDLGIERARGEHVVLLNNDTRVRPGWLQALVRAAETDPAIGAVTSKLVFMERPGVIQNAGSLVLTDGSGGDRGMGEEDLGQYDRREEVFAACGCAVLLRRPMLEDVGVLDSTFFAYYEDTDLSWRMRLRGWRIVYEPTAVVEHHHSGTSGEWSPFFIFHVDRNRLFMILKNAPPGFVLRAFSRYGWLAARSFGRGSARTILRRGRMRGEAVGSVGKGSAGTRARVHIRVVASLLVHLPEMLAKRWRIRRGHKVADAQIVRWFYARELWDAH
jgi:N-acetylglucosaminyl-diphospho-decaprenol L-rhamnosyltransferase